MSEKIFSRAEELIGNTPLLRLTAIEKEENLNVRLLAKLECLNVTGSAKDRAAKEMIDDALERGILREGSVIIEPTSGNTGIGLASVAVRRGYKVIIVMPENMSDERKKLMRAYGAELVLTPASEGMSGAIKKAEEIAAATPYSFIPDQFNNTANANAHYKSTGPEIWRDTDGNVDIFVAGVGTGGTISGTGRYLKEQNKNIRVVAVEPKSSALLSGGTAGAHKIQGIGANFIPSLLDRSIYDEVIDVENDDAIKNAARVGKKEGVLVGISSGASLTAAIELAKREENAGKTIVVLFPDSGDRYYSTEMFE